MRKFLAMLLAALMLLAVVGCTAPAADGQKDAADDKKTEAPADGKTEDNKTEDNKPAYRKAFAAKVNGLCPRCHTYCYGDCRLN